MPITKSQQELVIASIDHFLIDLPQEEKELKSKVNDLEKACAGTLSKENDFYLLQQCIYHPENYLHRIEAMNPDITLIEIQECIFGYIQQRSEEAAKAAKVELTINFKALLQELKTNERFNTIFRSAPLAESKSAGVKNKRSFKVILMEYTEITESWSFLIETPVGDFSYSYEVNDNDIDQQMVINNAYPLIETMISNKLHEYFVHEHVFEQKPITNSAKKLLTYRYYFDLLNERKMDGADISDIGEEQFSVLIEPIAIALQKQKICSIKEVIKFSPKQLNVVSHPFYYDKISKKEFKLEAVYLLTNEQCTNITWPPSIELIKNGKVSFSDIASMTLSQRKIISNEFYFRKIMEDPTLFQAIKKMSLTQQAILLDPEVITQFSENGMKLNDIMIISDTTIRFLASKELFCAEDISNSSESSYELSENKELLSVNLIKSKTIFHACLNKLHQRRQKFFDGKPAVMLDGKPDTLEKIKEGYRIIKHEFNKDDEAFFIKEINKCQNNKELIDQVIQQSITAGLHLDTALGWKFAIELIEYFITNKTPRGEVMDKIIDSTPELKQPHSLVILRELVISELQKFIYVYLKNNTDFSYTEQVSVSVAIYKELNRAKTKEKELKSEAELENHWQQSLDNIYDIAYQYYMKSMQWEYEKNQQLGNEHGKRKRTISFFTDNLLSQAQKIRDDRLCKWIIELENVRFLQLEYHGERSAKRQRR